MRREDTRSVIKAHSLFSSETSALVLNAIASGKLEKCDFLPPKYQRRLVTIASAYSEKVAGLSKPIQPRNLPFYLILKDRYPAFQFRQINGQMQIEGYFRGMKPTVLSLLLGMVPIDQLASNAQESKNLVNRNLQSAAAQCRATFDSEGAVLVDDSSHRTLLEWIRRGKAGEPLALASIVCPAYSAAHGEDGRMRYTFSGLDDGIGIAAERIYRSCPALNALFRDELELATLTQHIYIGDFEGFSEDNLKRIGITAADFAAKTGAQRKSLENVAPSPVTAGVFSDLVGGIRGWASETERMKCRFAAGDLELPLPRQTIAEIAQSRKSLYRRWFGKELMHDSFLEALVTHQAIDYATAGHVLRDKLRNPLLLCAGSPQLAGFYRLAATDLTVLCLSSDDV